MKKGFTLAEVLITLGIVGVVAAMTLPVLIQNYQHKVLANQLKKSYSELAQVTRMILVNEFDNNPIMFVNARANSSVYVRYFQQYLKGSTICNTDSTKFSVCPVSSNAAWKNYVESNYKSYNNLASNGSCVSDIALMLNDGTFLIIDNGVYLTVDVNGWKKRPNKFGHDFFMFEIVNGQLVPMGLPGTRFTICSATSGSSENGRGCTYKALYDKDYWKNLP